MRLLMVSLCVACIPAFSQSRESQDEIHLRVLNQVRESVEIARSIAAHQSFQLPASALGPTAMVRAREFVKTDGYTVRLKGVEVITDSIIVYADELTYWWATGAVEPSGNVRLRPIPQ